MNSCTGGSWFESATLRSQREKPGGARAASIELRACGWHDASRANRMAHKHESLAEDASIERLADGYGDRAADRADGRAGAREDGFDLAGRICTFMGGPLVAGAHQAAGDAGHEFCGTVERVGDEVRAVMAGDFVSAEMHVNCGIATSASGQAHICQNLRIIGLIRTGVRGVREDAASNIWRLDPAIPEHYGAILDPLGNAVHTVLAGPVRTDGACNRMRPDRLMAIAVAKLGGVRRYSRRRQTKNGARWPRNGADAVLNRRRRCGRQNSSGNERHGS